VCHVLSFHFLCVQSCFLLDLLPFVRVLVCLAVDSSGPAALASAAAAADAALAASLQARDGGRSSRRNTRALQAAVPKLSRRSEHEEAGEHSKHMETANLLTLVMCVWPVCRRWQQVSDCFWKNSAAETVRMLQSCAWASPHKRSLQLQSVWQPVTESEAAAVSSAAVHAVPPAVPVAVPSSTMVEVSPPTADTAADLPPLLPIAEVSSSQEVSQQPDSHMML